jgi:dipeptidyl aminopeptidase/acylaminoacyl peptidase
MPEKLAKHPFHLVSCHSISDDHQRSFRAAAWDASPDGEHITFFPAHGLAQDEIWVMSSQGDNPQKVLASGESEWFGSVHWSPDGRRLAYIRVRRTPGGGSHGRAIETSDLTGAHRTLVLSNSELYLVDFLLASRSADHLLAGGNAGFG